MEGPLRFTKGDIAIVSNAGVVAEVDSRDPAATAAVAGENEGWSWSRLWRDRGDWGVPLIATVVVLILLLFARAAFVRNRRG